MYTVLIILHVPSSDKAPGQEQCNAGSQARLAPWFFCRDDTSLLLLTWRPQAHPPTYAGADLSVESLSDVLSRTAFDPARPALFTVEGLLYYIPLSAVESLFRSISSIAAPGSRVCFDFLDSDVLEGKAEGTGFETAVKVRSMYVCCQGI